MESPFAKGPKLPQISGGGGYMQRMNTIKYNRE